MADIEINLETTDAKELLRSGHHAFVMKDYGNAAAAFGKATQLMAQEHGDENDLLGEIYLRYGRALLEVSREESEPFGDAIPKETDSDEDDDEETAPEPDEPEEKTDEDEKVTNGSTNGDEPGPSSSDGAGPSHSNGEATESTEEGEKDDASDLQIAWEVLEVAKKIFTIRGDKGKELLAETLVLLGEIGMESENFADAAKDIQAGLEMQQTVYEKDNRKLAETQYKLGVAHANLSNIEEAVKYFDMSIETLNNRVETLNRIGDNCSKKEIEEITELIPDIKEKINDVKTIKDEVVVFFLI